MGPKQKDNTRMSDFVATERTQVHRLPKRGVYDRETVYSILDEGLVCHVAFVVDGKPVVIPTGYGRKDDTLYVHGSPASRMFRALGKGADVCVTVTLVDGLVLARSAFHHSMNYRSVVIFGKATVLEDPAAKREALRVFTEHVAPGRWQEVRQPSEKELQATTVLGLPLEEVSAKVRVGPPIDDEEDYTWPVWAGILPLDVMAQTPLPDERLPKEIAIPEYVRTYTRKRCA
jgi:nitroimidazol reductase NimA-like FMN-containing flavoprotein (pyridoxamine 5'-phosphate oxidase superfamily)